MSDVLHSVDPDTLLAHHAWMRRLARRLVLDDSEADDVVQEAWLKAAERPPRQAESLRAWLATVVRNAARQLARGESRRTRRERAAAREEGLPSTLDLVARAEARRTMTDATLALDEPFRTTILLRFFEGLPPREIAKRQGVPVETVRSRVRRGIARMRVDLDRSHGGSRAAWSAVLIPIMGPAVPGAVGPGEIPVDAPPQPGLPSIPGLPGALGPLAAGVALVATGAALGWSAAPDRTAVLTDLRAEIHGEREAADRLSAAAADTLGRADRARFEARRLRSQTLHRATRVVAAATEMATVASRSAHGMPPVVERAPSFIFPEYADVLHQIDWTAAGRDFAALLRAVREVAEPLHTGRQPSPEAIGELRSRSGPVTELALRLQRRGIPGVTPNLVLAHPAVMSNLLPPAFEALGVPLSAAQETHLERLAQTADSALQRQTDTLDDGAILLRRMAVESAALAPWMESIDRVLADAQRDLARPEAYRGRLGLDLISAGLLWPVGTQPVRAGEPATLVESVDADLLARTFPAGTPGRERARDVVEAWATHLPAAAFAASSGSVGTGGAAITPERMVFWVDRTAGLLEALRDQAAATASQRRALENALRPLVPVSFPANRDRPR